MTDTPEKNDDPDEAAASAAPRGTEALFGDYSIRGPGVQIILDGRPVSAPAAE